MPRHEKNKPRSEIDIFLKTPAFQERIEEADAYARENDLDKWSTRILWVALSEGTRTGRRYAMRRSEYLFSKAWNRWKALLDGGWVDESGDGFRYDPRENDEWEENPLMWFSHIANAITPDT